MSNVTKWVLLDESDGAKTGDGSSLTPEVMAEIAAACNDQLNNEFASYYGGDYEVRVGKDSTDIEAGEYVYSFVPTLADAPGASAYHDENGDGVPVAFCAVTTCGSLTGPDGVSVDATHELCEAAADPGCNTMCDNGNGQLIAYEVCDPVETQTYESHSPSAKGVQVTNFVFPSWFNPKGKAPFDYMCSVQIIGGVSPPGPMQIAPSPGGQGNYEIIETSSQQSDVFGIKGTPRKPRTDTASRFVRRTLIRASSNKKRFILNLANGSDIFKPEQEGGPATPELRYENIPAVRTSGIEPALRQPAPLYTPGRRPGPLAKSTPAGMRASPNAPPRLSARHPEPLKVPATEPRLLRDTTVGMIKGTTPEPRRALPGVIRANGTNPRLEALLERDKARRKAAGMRQRRGQ